MYDIRTYIHTHIHTGAYVSETMAVSGLRKILKKHDKQVRDKMIAKNYLSTRAQEKYSAMRQLYNNSGVMALVGSLRKCVRAVRSLSFFFVKLLSFFFLIFFLFVYLLVFVLFCFVLSPPPPPPTFLFVSPPSKRVVSHDFVLVPACGVRVPPIDASSSMDRCDAFFASV